MGEFILITADDEVYKPITYPRVRENFYEISNYGDIRRIHDSYQLKPHYDKDGYQHIGLIGEERGITIDCRIHRLVAWEFIGPPPSEDENVCNHKNSVRDCNYYENLEWVSHLDNSTHGIEFGRKNRNHLLKYNPRKYDTDLVIKYINHMSDGLTNSQICDLYDLHGRERKLTMILLRDIRRGSSYRNEYNKYYNKK